jgi:hypothetical protein
MQFDYTTKENCYNAVLHSGLNLKHVPLKFMDSKICELAVDSSGQAIRYVPNHFQNLKIILKAMSKYKNAYQHIDQFFKLNRNLAYIAAKQDKENLKFIPEENQDIKNCFEFISQNQMYNGNQILQFFGKHATETMFYKIIRDVIHDFREVSNNPIESII